MSSQNNKKFKKQSRAKKGPRKVNRIQAIDFPTINRATTPLLNMTTKTADESLFFDFALAATSGTTTAVSASMLDTLLSSTGILAVNDTYARPIWIGTAGRWTSRIHITHMDVRIHAINAQGTLLAAGDIYNTIRFMTFVSNTSYGGVNPIPLIDTINHPITNNVAKVLCDDTLALRTTAFTTADLNAPSHEVLAYSCPVNVILDCVSSNTRTTWDTKAGDVYLCYVADSSVSPHPSFYYAARIHFRVLKTG